jgi:hypothetical protein
MHPYTKAFAWAAAAVAATATAAALALVVSSLLGIGPSLGQRLFLEPILVANNSVPGLTCLKMVGLHLLSPVASDSLGQFLLTVCSCCTSALELG